jgi:hypothetical protein
MRVDLPDRVEPRRRKEQPNFSSGNWRVSMFWRGIGWDAEGSVNCVGAVGAASGADFSSAFFFGGILIAWDFFFHYNSMQKNDFLRQFVEMRKAIAPSGAAAARVEPPASKRAKKTSSAQKVSEGGLQHIIENKPGRKEVEEYFQTRCDELTSEKMT